MLNVCCTTLLPSVYPVNMQHGFSISEENSVDPDQMAPWIHIVFILDEKACQRSEMFLNHMNILEKHMLYYKDNYIVALH